MRHQSRVVLPQPERRTLVLTFLICLFITLAKHRANPDVAVLRRALVRPGAEMQNDEAALPPQPHFDALTLPLVPRWSHWAELELREFEADLFAVGNCVGWQQTRGCDPDGAVEPYYNKPCREVVGQASGYCLCRRGLRVKHVACGTWNFTCADACDEAAEARLSSSAPPLVDSGRSRGRELVAQLLASGASHDSETPFDAFGAVGGDLYEHGAYARAAEERLIADVVQRRVADAKFSAVKKAYDEWVHAYSEARSSLSTSSGESACVGWHQFRSCTATETEVDDRFRRPCGSVIRDGIAGYCDCGNEVAPVVVSCSHRAFTCNQACSNDFELNQLTLPRGAGKPQGSRDTAAASRAKEAAPILAGGHVRKMNEAAALELASSRTTALGHLASLDALRRSTGAISASRANSSAAMASGHSPPEHKADSTKPPSEVRHGSGVGLLKESLWRVFGKLPHAQGVTQDPSPRDVSSDGDAPLRLVSDALRDTDGTEAYYRYLDDVVRAASRRSAERRHAANADRSLEDIHRVLLALPPSSS